MKFSITGILCLRNLRVFAATILTLSLLSGCATDDMAYRSVTYVPKKNSEKFQCLEAVDSNDRSRIVYLEYGTHGNRLRAEQMNVARHTLREMQGHGRRVVLVSYVHGWKHGSLSGDALQFRNFINQLSSIGKQRNFLVMGIYCAWPGAFWGPLKKMEFQDCQKLERAFPAAPLVKTIPEQLTVWDRYTVAHQVGTRGALTGDIKELTRQAHVADPRSISLCVGHSMGAFILELGVVREMAGIDRNAQPASTPDLVFLMNSAAPAILADQAVTKWKNSMKPEKMATFPPETTHPPQVVSLTSDGDWATGRIAPIGFAMGPLNPMMLDVWNECDPRFGDWLNMIRCPGHTNHLLTWYTNKVNPSEWAPVSLKKTSVDAQAQQKWFFGKNLRLPPAKATMLPDRQFSAFDSRGNELLWRFNWDKVKHGPCENRTPYWVVQTGQSLIRDHGDIWDTQAASVMMAAVYEAGILRN